jgi:hypothetical protein
VKWAAVLGVVAAAGCTGAHRPAPAAASDADDDKLPFVLAREDRFHSDPAATVAVDILASADADHDGKDDRELSFVAGDGLIVEEYDSHELRRYPLDGGPATVVAAGLPRVVLSDGDQRGVYWVTGDCEIWQAPAQKLGTCTGSPWFFLVDVRDLYVFAETPRADGSPGMQVWRLARGAGGAPAVERVADLGGLLNRRPDRRPLQDQDAFYFTDAERTLQRLDKRSGALRQLAAIDQDRTGHLRLAGIDAAFAYWSLDSRLMRTPLAGGLPLAIANVDGAPVQMLGDRFYLVVGGTVYAAPRAGGRLQQVATLPTGVSHMFQRGGSLYALGREHLVRFNLAAPHPRKLFDTQERERDGADDLVIGSLAASGSKLYFTLGAGADLRELWSIPKRGGAPERLTRGGRLDAAPLADDGSVTFVEEGNLRRIVGARGAVETLATRDAVTAALGGSPAPPAPDAATELLLPRVLAADERFVYWRHDGGRPVLRIPRQGGRLSVVPAREAERIAKLFQASTAEPLLLGETAFFTTGDDIRSQSLHDGHVRVLSSGHHTPVALLADDDAVYFLTIGERGGIVVGHRRVDCCAIWAAPR